MMGGRVSYLCLCVFLYYTVCLCYGGTAKRSTHEHSDTKVLVLGAGMSGISAATTLMEAGYTNIQILEATDRIGGRVKNTQLGGYTVELGAMWIYGKGKNPVYELVEKFNISTTDSYSDSWTVLDVDGTNVTDMADSYYEKFDNILTNISEFSKTSSRDITFEGALKYFQWTNKSTTASAVEAYMTDYELGIAPNAHSAKYLYLLETFEDFENDDMLILNDTTGFVKMIEGLGDDITATDANRILLNTEVTEIQYHDDSVVVLTRDGQTFEADFVIVTFGLGVLQERQVAFEPELPDMKQFVIDTFGVTSYMYIYLRFSNAFWDDTMYVLYASHFRERTGFILNLNALYPGSNILQFSKLDSAAIWAESTEESEVIAELLEELGNIYPNAIIPSPIDYAFSGWNLDPFTQGAWSYWPPSFTEEDMNLLMAPVGRVHFAGEYAHELHYSFLHAAQMSGEREAKSIIKCIEYPTTCSKLDAWEDLQPGDSNACTSGSASGLILRLDQFIVACVFVLLNLYLFY